MHKKQKIKLLKVCALMFAVLCCVIITIALLDPNLREILNNSSVYVSSSASEDDGLPQTPPKDDKASSESSKKEENDKTDSKDEYADLIIQKPNKYYGDELCQECHGTGMMTCPSCIGNGTECGATCLTCYGNGKIRCEFCK